MRGPLTVAQVAEALGTSPQTVRALLRKGQLRGEQRPWGSRYVWEVSPEGLDDFLSTYGRLDGHRRSAPPTPAAAPTVPATPAAPAPAPAPPSTGSREYADLPAEPDDDTIAEQEQHVDRRPLFLRPRGRATVAVVVLGLPLLLAYAAVRTVPDALWFDELAQGQVFRGLIAAKIEFRVLVAGTAAVFIWINLLVACGDTSVVRRGRGILALAAAALVAGSFFASAVAGHWQTYLLWRHRQPFGVLDPVHGKDIGYFVFTLPFEVLVSDLLLWLVLAAAACVVVVHAARGTLGMRPPRATFPAQLHLAVLAAAFLLALAWRLQLERYLLELQQPELDGSRSFAGEGYVDVHVRTPGLIVLACIAVALAVGCVATPYIVRWSRSRRVPKLLAVTGALVVATAVIAMAVVPALVQRFVVDPNQLLSEKPFLERSTTATRHALGLDRIEVEPYSSSGQVTAGHFASVNRRLAHVATWDTSLLGDRMRQLVTNTPYFSPDQPTLDVVPVDGRPEPTVVSARELDLGPNGEQARSWSSDRLAYTHGLGLIRFSGTDVGPDREPRVLDSGLGVRQPRIYFGDFPHGDTSGDQPETSTLLAPTIVKSIAESPWVLVDTRRSEVDITAPLGSPRRAYHYRGPAGISLSSWERRAVFALALGSKQLFLSDDITSRSRILLHRDVHERLATLAPFIHWDASAVPLTVGGRILFVVDGYTTSTDYPYAELTDLGGTRVGYARASVRATVDAYSGRVTLYLTDPTDPLARAWSEAFPSLFRAADEIPAEVRERVRYPEELFDAQAASYERFHTDDADILASGSDLWSRPIALSGSLEVAGGVDFDESDEDDLRLTMEPAYSYGSPPGHGQPQLVLNTYYVPRQGQNLVASLTGWVDGQGRPRLVSRSLPRDPTTLGPAQVSRLVFATPRVSNLLGLRNLEIRDLNTSSLDSVILGIPHLLFLPGGLMQVQSLYEGSRGPGAARLLGVTVFVNGRAGLGPDMATALRQALNKPPLVDVRRPRGTASVGTPVAVHFRVENARREIITITSGTQHKRVRLGLDNGRGTVTWTPTASGRAHAIVSVIGLDGTRIHDATSFRVLSRPPQIRLVTTPKRAVVGRPVRIAFKVAHGRHASVRVSTLSGIVFTRSYLLRHHLGVVKWTPEVAGPAVVLLRARGGQGQIASASLRLQVRARASTASPSIELLRVPSDLVAGTPATFALRADGCRVAVARISGPVDDVPVFRFPCPVHRGTFAWTPGAPGSYLLTAVARGPHGLTSSQRVRLGVAPAPSSSPSSTPSSGPAQAPPAGPSPSPSRGTLHLLQSRSGAG